MLIPEKLMKPKAIRAVTINVIPNPLSGFGISEYSNFSLIAAKPNIASSQPIPEPNPYAVAIPTSANSRCCMNNEPPKIAQFTAISGRNIPKEEYRAGLKRSITISTSCTIAAIIAMKIKRLKTLKSTSANSGPIHERAPNPRT